MYTYHKFVRLPVLKYNAKKYYCFMRDDDCKVWHHFQNFKTITVTDNDDFLRPRLTMLFANSSADLFWYFHTVTDDKVLEWHLFGEKADLSSCVRPPFPSHWDKRFEQFYSAPIGIVGVPLYD